MAKVVLHIHSLGLGGAERVVLDWLEWLVEDGHQVWLLLGTQDQKTFFTVPKGVMVLTPPRPRHGPALPSVIWLRRCLLELKPDCAIGMTTRPALNLLLAGLGQPWPVVVAERNYPPAKVLPLPWRWLRRWLYPGAAQHLVQTERIGRWLVGHGLARRVACVPNAVHWPLVAQSPRTDPSTFVPQGAALLLAVGTKPIQKGFDRLLLAFSRLASAYPNWWLALPGVDPQDSQLLTMLDRVPGPKDWQRRLVLPGRTGTLAAWYARADLFALTSRYEGFPNVLLEAMAAGCPSLAIDCPTGPREMISHGENGWLVESAASEQEQQRRLEVSLHRLISDQPLRERLGGQAQQVRTRFAVGPVRQAFLDVIEGCLAPRVMAFAPTRRSPTETFVRANLAQLPLDQIAYFGDEFGTGSDLPWARRLGQMLYGMAVLISKGCTVLGFQRLATLLPSLVAWGLIRCHRPDVLLAEFGFHAVRVMDAARWSDVPLVVHFRGADAFADRRVRPLAERYRRLMRLASGFIVKSQAMQRVLEGFGAPPERITISPSGADARLFTGAAPAEAPPTVLFVGRFVEKKAPLDALEAFALAQRRLPFAVQLELIGDGALRVAVEDRIRALGLEGQVTLLGLQAPAQVAERMRHVRCLLLPSRVAADGDSEGCPVALLEAQVAGLPVVSTRHAGIPEVVLEDRTAFLVDEGDIEALALGLERLLKDPKLAGQMGLAAANYARERFTVSEHISTVAEVLRRAAARF